MSQTIESKNKALVLEAFDTLFNKRDYAAAEGFWSPNYIQHSAHIAPGRDGLFNLIKSLPPTLKYEPGTIVAERDLVIVHATHLLRAGVHPKVVSERLGHARVGITMDVYSHVLPGMQKEAAKLVEDRLLGQNPNPRIDRD